MSEFVIRSINISAQKGTAKTAVAHAVLRKGIGITTDSHRGMKNRELSLLSREEIDGFKADLIDGSFGENLTISGLDTNKIRLLDRIRIGKILLEVSKIGKECHDRCHIYQTMGTCIMPKKGFFTRVLRGGKLRPGASAQYIPKVYSIAVITLSDRASKGQYEDKSGKLIVSELEASFSAQGKQTAIEHILLPDSRSRLFFTLLRLLFLKKVDMVFTTGGTGISRRDITIETVRPLIKKELPGIMEHIRTTYGQHNKNALTSRSLAGVRNKALVFCLPGSVKGVKEYMAEIVPMLNHLVAMVHDVDLH